MRQKVRRQLGTIFTIIILTLTVAGYSQTVNDAKAKYNEGAQLIKTDIQGALNAFNKCIEICNSLGEEGKETKILAESQIPKLNYTLAKGYFDQKKYNEALEGFTVTFETAEKYNNEQVKTQCKRYLTLLFNNLGNSFYRKNEFEKAMENFNQALKYNPLYAKAYFGKGRVYEKLDDLVKMKEAMDKAIETGLSKNDIKTVENAEKVTRNTFYNKGVKAFEAKNYDEAEGYLKTSIEYGNQSVDTHFQLGKIYNIQKNWNDAIKNVNKAIELETGDDTAKAKLYFELATSYVGSGDTNSACEAYKKAMFGPYAENAKYQIEQVLKCK
ncbi:MAG: tetratricopeptide repeat protein [Bacteroidetes bacterium]|nr:tetratricopeptide repeat protein [Bacteroidota bacterium]